MAVMTSDQSGINLGSCIAGIPVKVHWSFFLLLGIELYNSLSDGEGELWVLLVMLLYGPILLITIVIPGFGHALATRKLGGEVGSIVLWPLGGLTTCGPTNQGPWGDLKVAVAGSLTHIPQMAFWLLLYVITKSGDMSTFFDIFNTRSTIQMGFVGFFSSLCQLSFWLNVVIFSFNLLVPAYPLNGGRCLAASLTICGCTPDKSAMIVSTSSMTIALVLGTYGIFVAFVHANLNGIFTLLVAIYIFSSGKQLFDLAKAGRAREHPMFGREYFESRDEPTLVNETELPAEPLSPEAEII